jgi:hypothetical protein
MSSSISLKLDLFSFVICVIILWYEKGVIDVWKENRKHNSHFDE